MLSGYGFFKVYHPVKLHFTSSYDALKYKSGSKSINRDTFNNRKDKQRFDYWASKVQSKEEALELCIFNFANNNKTWFYTDYNEAKAVLFKTKAYYGALKKNLKEETLFVERIMKEQKVRFSQLIKSTSSGDIAPLLQLFLKGKVSKEFMCFLDNGFLNEWMVEYSADPLVQEELGHLTKYKQFAILLSKEGN